jgi:hypothetical protein
MKVCDAFPSEYVSAVDVGDKKPIVTCDYVEERTGENFRTRLPEQQFYMHMHGTEKTVKLNPTSARTIEKDYGGEMEDWRGQKMMLFTVEQSLGGELKLVLYVRAAPAANSNGAPAGQTPPAQQQEAPPVTTGPPVTVVAGNTVDGDDDLPF